MRKEAEMNDSDLDDLFAVAKRHKTAVSSDLMARVMADADLHMPRPVVPKRVVAPRVGVWSAIVTAIGGAGALAGLSTATLAGVWIGFAQPTAISAVTDVLWTDEAVYETVDVLPAFDDFLTEG